MVGLSEVVSLYAIHVQGIVQGVGFRPFVFRLAQELQLQGTVANDGRGVHIRLAGTTEQVERFVQKLRSAAPPAARISSLEVEVLAPFETAELELAPGFHILPSTDACSNGNVACAAISPDLATCGDCRAEIFDPANRRFRYPFTNCTNCGPRFTISARIPYDRPNTSMRVFPMCTACRQEYDNPLDRRFHAQPNACPVCGPQLSWHDANGTLLTGDTLSMAAVALQEGAVVAIKGLGGFHLAVDATNNTAVLKLRQRKQRPAKPLAVMVADLATARSYCQITVQEAELLTSAAHPIVLLEVRKTGGLAPTIAPGLGIIGLMLAYTPLHHLLLAEEAAPPALVMTSGNPSDSPICTQNSDALRRLQGLADYFLLHNRDILTRVDDSVLRVMAGAPRLIRRARGYAPAPIVLAQPCANILACGAEMKNTFCIVRNNEAYLSQHIGTLRNTEAFDFYEESIAHLQEVLECTPDRLACDLHPDYLSTRHARRRMLPLCAVQHHHAHALAVMAEYGLDGEVLALILDGAGYGADGTVFGGELYRVTRARYQRLASLAPLPLPGGDQAVAQPWRLALAWLWQYGALGEGDRACPLSTVSLPPALERISPEKRRQISSLLQKNLNCPPCSSAGRLFDAVSALLGLCLYSEYEGQAAMLLEQQASLARPNEKSVLYPVQIDENGSIRRIETSYLCRAVLQDCTAGCSVPAVAWRFHHWLAESWRTAVAQLSRETGLTKILLAGGCMQNKILLEMLVAGLAADGMQVYAGVEVPANDGGISLGQAFYTGDKTCA